MDGLTKWTHVFEQVHEAGSEAPRFVSVALKGADGDLGGALWGCSHHVNSIIHQSWFSLKEKRSRHHPGSQTHLSHQDQWCMCTASYGISNQMQSHRQHNHSHSRHGCTHNQHPWGIATSWNETQPNYSTPFTASKNRNICLYIIVEFLNKQRPFCLFKCLGMSKCWRAMHVVLRDCVYYCANYIILTW